VEVVELGYPQSTGVVQKASIGHASATAMVQYSNHDSIHAGLRTTVSTRNQGQSLVAGITIQQPRELQKGCFDPLPYFHLPF